MGQWLCVFDWVVWAAFRLVALQFLFWGNADRRRRRVRPKTCPTRERWRSREYICTAICCMSTTRGLLPAATSNDLFPRTNHYALAIPLPSRASPVADLAWRASSGPSGPASLRAVCQRVGYAVIETVTDGKCIPHTMAKFERRDETPLVFRLILKELAAYTCGNMAKIFFARQHLCLARNSHRPWWTLRGR